MAKQQLLNAVGASLGMTPTGVQHIRAAYPIKEAAHLCGGVSQWWLRQQYYSGKIKGLKAGPKLLIPASEIDKLLTSMETPYEPATDGIGAAQRARAIERRKTKAAPSSKRKVADA